MGSALPMLLLCAATCAFAERFLFASERRTCLIDEVDRLYSFFLTVAHTLSLLCASLIAIPNDWIRLANCTAGEVVPRTNSWPWDTVRRPIGAIPAKTHLKPHRVPSIWVPKQLEAA
jgi:hypothetical protein